MSRGPAPPGRALICAARFNEVVGRLLVDGAVGTLERAGYDPGRMDIVWVAGAFELPLVIDRGLRTGKYRLAVALGAIIRGQTPHFEYLAAEATRGLGSVSLAHGIPIGYGVLTCDTLEQALERAGAPAGAGRPSRNKGAEAAEAALASLAAVASLEGDAPA